MTPWTGWERRDRHVSFALLLSLPKLDVGYRKARASKLDRSTPVQIQVSSTWFCSCLYGNDLANVTAFCSVAKSVEVGSEFGLTWSIASQFYSATLETQPCFLLPELLLAMGPLRCWVAWHPSIILSLKSLLQEWMHKVYAARTLCPCSALLSKFPRQEWEFFSNPVQETAQRPLSGVALIWPS